MAFSMPEDHARLDSFELLLREAPRRILADRAHGPFVGLHPGFPAHLFEIGVATSEILPRRLSFINQRRTRLTRSGLYFRCQHYLARARAQAPSLEHKRLHPVHLWRYTTASHL